MYQSRDVEGILVGGIDSVCDTTTSARFVSSVWHWRKGKEWYRLIHRLRRFRHYILVYTARYGAISDRAAMRSSLLNEQYSDVSLKLYHRVAD
jgi:hypothetical protein